MKKSNLTPILLTTAPAEEPLAVIGRKATIMHLLLVPILLAVCLPAWGQEAKGEIHTIKIFHPNGKDAESFVRSQHVAVGSVGDMHEKEGVMVCNIHHPHYNFTYGGAFIETFRIIKPTDDHIVAGFKKHKNVLLIKCIEKPGHWEVVGLEAPYPIEPKQDKPSGWLPASFLDSRMKDEMFRLSKYRYKGFINDNLEHLKDKDPKVRSRAMNLLRVIEPDATDVSKVIDKLAKFINSNDSSERRDAMYALGGIGGQHAERHVPSIAELLDSKVIGDQGAAIAAICMIGGQEAQKHIPRIIELMQDKPGPPPHGIVYSLGELGGQAASALPALIDALKAVDKRDRNNVEVIIITLGKIAPSDQKVIDALSPLLDHESSFVRQLSKRALDGKYFKRPAPENHDRSIK